MANDEKGAELCHNEKTYPSLEDWTGLRVRVRVEERAMASRHPTTAPAGAGRRAMPPSHL